MRYATYLILLCIFSLSCTHAATSRDGGSGGANAQTQALIQQLGMERTRLNAENAKLKKELKKLKKTNASLEANNEQLVVDLTNIEQQLSSKTQLSEELLTRLQDAKSKMEELIGRFREAIANLRQVEQENADRANQITRLEQTLTSCATHNVALSELGYELIGMYENKTGFDRLGQLEPITQIKRVQIENLVDDYTYMIMDETFTLEVIPAQ